MPDIAFRSIAGNSISGTATGTKTLTVNKPAGTVNGDVMVAIVMQSAIGGVVPPAPAGWTVLATQTPASNTRADMLYKVASAEGASYNFTVGGGDPYVAVGFVASYSGADAAPIDAVGSQTNASSASAVAPSVAPTVTGDMLVCCFASVGPNTTFVSSTPPGGMTERGDAGVWVSDSSGYSAGDVQASLNDVLLASTSPTGAKTATLSAARDNYGFSALLRPAGAPPPPASAVGLHMIV